MRRVGFVLTPGFQMMYLAAISAFEFANLCAGKRLYDVETLSEAGGLTPSSHGLRAEAAPFGDPAFDTLVVGGVLDDAAASTRLIDFVLAAQASSRRVASICTGAFVLAQAGILDGRRATTHWAHTRRLRERHPKVLVEDDPIFIVDGAVWTSAGMSAGVDLALAMVEKDEGPDLSRSVARKLVLHHRRAGGQSQHSELLEVDARSDRIRRALDHARGNLKGDLSVERLADAARLSPRQFSRVFHAETGQSPAKAVELLRLDAARLLMEQSRQPVETVAQETGFLDRERMRRAFLRAFGQPPQVIRRNALQSRQA